MMKFKEQLETAKNYPLTASEVNLLQVNTGYQCNMVCKHCHVQAGPLRIEVMDLQVIDEVLMVLRGSSIQTLDITGGAPELNPHFRYLVREARRAGKHVIVRSNLTIYFEAGMADLPEFYRSNRVEVIASLPYFLQENVDRVRGDGTFQKSVEAIRMLNSLGYGHEADMLINLVYNPQGAFLPASQTALEDEYKRELRKRFSITFNNLYVFTNMPIGRFRDFLVRTGRLDTYMEKLTSSFNPGTVDNVMCRHMINVGWDGRLYDCDFNQMMGLGLSDGSPRHIHDFDYDRLAVRKIAVDDHCFGCTAGQGST